MKHFLSVIITAAFVAIVFSGCKTTSQIAVAPKKIKHLSVGRVIRLAKDKSLNFETLSVKKISLSINNNGKSTSARGFFKIRRDSVIQVSAQKLAIPVGKMEINADSFRIVYYLDQQNIFGSFDYISDMLGIDVDYTVVQSVLTGQLFSIHQDSRDYSFRDYACQIENDLYKITSIRDRKFRKLTKNEDRLERYRNRLDDDHLIKQDIYIDPDSFVVRKMIFDDMDFNRNLSFDFSGYEKINNQWFPSAITMKYTGDKTIKVSMELSKITLDDERNFNFSTSPKYKNRFLATPRMQSGEQ